jgi:hypothetical protein
MFEDIAYRRLRIDCSEISLVRSGAPPLDIKGRGEIWVDQDGMICFKFSLSPEQYQPYTKATLEHPRPVPENPKDEDYFELTALTSSGETLRGRLLYPEVDSNAPRVFGRDREQLKARCIGLT